MTFTPRMILHAGGRARPAVRVTVRSGFGARPARVVRRQMGRAGQDGQMAHRLPADRDTDLVADTCQQLDPGSW